MKFKAIPHSFFVSETDKGFHYMVFPNPADGSWEAWKINTGGAIPVRRGCTEKLQAMEAAWDYHNERE